MNSIRLLLFFGIVGLVCLGVLFSGRICFAQNPVPNILLVIVDDMGWGDPGCYGGIVKTPNIDQLATEGMRFTSAYSGSCVCAPARSALMTGYHTGHTSVRNNSGGVSLSESDITLAMMLKPFGYRIGGFGKWGLGDTNSPGVPEKKGFDEFFGYYHQIHAHNHFPGYLWRNSVLEYQRRGADGRLPYAPYTVFENTKRFIQQSVADKVPFFCYCPWTPPHGDFVIPDSDPAVAFYKDKPWSEKIKAFAAMGTMVDRHFGELMELLEELNIADSTIVIFMSDNGAESRHEGTLNSAGPFRGEKGSLYEGGIRVPFIVKWSHKIAAGTVTDLPVAFYDIPATLHELIGKPVPGHGDGISFAPTLLGKSDQQKKHEYLYWEYELVDWAKLATGRVTIPATRQQAIRLANWKGYRKTPDAPIELYDLAADIGEKNNIAEKHPDVVGKIRNIMINGRTEMRPQPEPVRPDGRFFN